MDEEETKKTFHKLIQDCDYILDWCIRASDGSDVVDTSNQSWPYVKFTLGMTNSISSKLEENGKMITELEKFFQSISEPISTIIQNIVEHHKNALDFVLAIKQGAVYESDQGKIVVLIRKLKSELLNVERKYIVEISHNTLQPQVQSSSKTKSQFSLKKIVAVTITIIVAIAGATGYAISIQTDIISLSDSPESNLISDSPGSSIDVGQKVNFEDSPGSSVDIDEYNIDAEIVIFNQPQVTFSGTAPIENLYTTQTQLPKTEQGQYGLIIEFGVNNEEIAGAHILIEFSSEVVFKKEWSWVPDQKIVKPVGGVFIFEGEPTQVNPTTFEANFFTPKISPVESYYLHFESDQPVEAQVSFEEYDPTLDL